MECNLSAEHSEYAPAETPSFGAPQASEKGADPAVEMVESKYNTRLVEKRRLFCNAHLAKTSPLQTFC